MKLSRLLVIISFALLTEAAVLPLDPVVVIGLAVFALIIGIIGFQCVPKARIEMPESVNNALKNLD